MSRSKTRLGGLMAILCVLAVMVAGATPAFAHHSDDHEQGEQSSEAERFGDGETGSDHDGDADSDEGTTTEDTDTNDGNTPEDQADEGDNQHPSGKDRSVENGKSESNPNQGKAESNPDDSRGPQRFEGGQGDDKADGPGGEDLADQDGNNGCGNDDDFDDDNNGHCGKPQPVTSPSPSVSPVVEVKTCPTNSALPMGHKDCVPPPCDADANMPGVQACVGSTNVCPTNPALPMNHKDCDDDTVVGTEFQLCPAGTDFAGMPMADLSDCNKDDEVSGRTDAAVPVKTCPSGPFAGMPFMNAADCGTPDDQEVLGGVITRNAVGGGALAAPASTAASGEAVLPFTGAGDLTSIAGIAMALLVAGTLALKLRSAR